jgi:ribonuclease BN (tRNA processing enzyme)
MKIKILGAHNTESQNTRMMSILLDDIVALDAGGLTSSLDFEAQKNIRAVLLTHHHYDHMRDIPALAMNMYLRKGHFQVCSIQSVQDALMKYLLNGDLYPNFLERPPDNPTIKFNLVRPFENTLVEGYDVLAVPTSHSIPATGYQITSGDGKVIFYTGDTGPGLEDCWKHISPQLLLIEVTASNQWEEFSKKAGHLCPSLLKSELIKFREIKGYLPITIAVHINPANEEEIGPELADVSRELDAKISLAREGLVVSV